MKKIPAGAEASNVLVGEVDFVEQRIVAFVRLADAVIFGQSLNCCCSTWCAKEWCLSSSDVCRFSVNRFKN